MGAAAQVTLEQAMELAQQYQATGKLLLADRTLQDILKSVPDYPPALHILGVVSYQRGNLPEALNLIARAVEQEPDNFLFNGNYGVMLSEVGQKEDAIKHFNLATEQNPDYADGYSNKANTLWELGRFVEAEEAARKALEIKPEYPDALLNLGNALQSQGQLDEAIACWEKNVEVTPNFDKAWSNLGNALRDKGRVSEAEEACRKAVELNPENAQGWNNRANALRDLGKTDEAIDCYRKATSILPSYADAHSNLAIALLEQNRLNEALESVRYALAFNPDHASAQSSLSIILREMGNLEAAEQAAQKAIVMRPEKANGYLDLADILFLSDRFDEAEVALEKAQSLEPDSPRAYLKLSGVLERLNRMEDALATLDKAEAMAPGLPEIHYRKGHIYYMSGLMDKARTQISQALELAPQFVAAYGTLAEIMQSENHMAESEETLRKAIALSPKTPFFHLSLGKLKKYTKDDDDFRHLLELEKDVDNMSKPNQACLHMALFKAWQDIGDYEKAFSHLKQGNDVKRQTVPYDPVQNDMLHDGIIRAHTAEAIAKKRTESPGYQSDAPIFIVGMPRSGTTLTEQIISSHSDVYACGELTFFSGICRDRADGTAEEIGREYVQKVYETFPEAKNFKFFTDKMPGNYTRLSEIALALPNAKIIHCRRDPIDTSLSCYKQLFARGQYWSYNLEELARQYNKYLELMAHWRKVLPGRFLEVDYEDTVGDLEAQARRMLDFIGLPWDKACLEPHKQERVVMTASKTQVTKPVYKSSVKSWQRYEEQLKPLIENIDMNLLNA